MEHQDDHAGKDDRNDGQDASVQPGELLLPLDRPPLQLKRFFGNPPVLLQVLSLDVADLDEQVNEILRVHATPPSSLDL
jgi:hypothetical protein